MLWTYVTYIYFIYIILINIYSMSCLAFDEFVLFLLT